MEKKIVFVIFECAFKNSRIMFEKLLLFMFDGCKMALFRKTYKIFCTNCRRKSIIFIC